MGSGTWFSGWELLLPYKHLGGKPRVSCARSSWLGDFIPNWRSGVIPGASPLQKANTAFSHLSAPRCRIKTPFTWCLERSPRTVHKCTLRFSVVKTHWCPFVLGQLALVLWIRTPKESEIVRGWKNNKEHLVSSYFQGTTWRVAWFSDRRMSFVWTSGVRSHRWKLSPLRRDAQRGNGAAQFILSGDFLKELPVDADLEHVLPRTAALAKKRAVS